MMGPIHGLVVGGEVYVHQAVQCNLYGMVLVLGGIVLLVVKMLVGFNFDLFEFYLELG